MNIAHAGRTETYCLPADILFVPMYDLMSGRLSGEVAEARRRQALEQAAAAAKAAVERAAAETRPAAQKEAERLAAERAAKDKAAAEKAAAEKKAAEDKAAADKAAAEKAAADKVAAEKKAAEDRRLPRIRPPPRRWRRKKRKERPPQTRPLPTGPLRTRPLRTKGGGRKGRRGAHRLPTRPLRRRRRPKKRPQKRSPKRRNKHPHSGANHVLQDDVRTGESTTVALSPFAPRKSRSFSERKATLVSSPVLSGRLGRVTHGRTPLGATRPHARGGRPDPVRRRHDGEGLSRRTVEPAAGHPVDHRGRQKRGGRHPTRRRAGRGRRPLGHVGSQRPRR